MNLNRRGLLAGSAAAALAATATTTTAQAAKPKTGGVPCVLRLSSQLPVIPGKSLEEKIAKMQKWGFDAVELPADVVGKEKLYRDAIKDTSMKLSAVCWGSINGDLVSEDKAKRGPAATKLKQTLTSAGELGTTGVIYVPAFNGQTKLANQEIRAILLDTLPQIGEHAVKVGSRLLLEPLNRKEAFFLRQLADAASICRMIS